MTRCHWVNNNPLYIKYHDDEWGIPSYDDSYLFEMLVLESFQAGLSWECILNKRANFAACLDSFDYHIISEYDDKKITELLNNPGIIRNKLKIKAMINNAKIFISIQKEYQTFSNYIWGFNNNSIEYGNGQIITHDVLSDKIAQDLYRRGMRFVGTTIIYSYLQAIGIINDHEEQCDKYYKHIK